MEIVTKKLSRFLIALGLVVFIAVSFFGISLTMGMEMKDDGSMSGCLFTGIEEICQMSFADHITAWQSMFTTLPQKTGLIGMLLLAIGMVIAAVFFGNRLLFDHSRLLFSRQRLYIRHNPHLSLFDPLKEAFSQGILNPKIYESVAI